jgi:hypothetical protein
MTTTGKLLEHERRNHYLISAALTLLNNRIGTGISSAINGAIGNESFVSAPLALLNFLLAPAPLGAKSGKHKI